MSPYGQAALILRWWPAIIEKIKICQRGERWRLPIQWTDISHDKLEPLKDPRDIGQAQDDAKPTTEATREILSLPAPSE
jgi:hypothetical protein